MYQSQFDFQFRPKTYWTDEAINSSPVEDGGVDIARIELESTLSDVIWILARQDGDRIRYAVMDEYDRDYTVTPDSSSEPLEMGQLIELIDSASCDEIVGLTDFFRDYTMMGSEDDPAKYVNFVQVRSDFYPELHD